MKPLNSTLLIFLFVFVSTDIMAQWGIINGVTSERLFATFTINNQEALIGGKDGVLFKTSNGGDNWTSVAATDDDVADIEFIDENTGFLVAGSAVFKTNDRGNSWLSSSVSANDDLVSISFPTAQTGFACSEGGEVIKTTDGGNSWQILNTVNGPEFSAIGFGDENTGVIVGTSGSVLHTTDGGSTWQDINVGVPEDLNDVCFSSPTKAYLVGGQGILMHSTNGGADWSNQVSLTVSDLNAICFIDENNGFAAGRDGVIVYTNNGGDLWNSETPITTGRLLDIHFSDASHGYAVGREGVILHYSVATGISVAQADYVQATVCPNPVLDAGSIKIENYKGLPWQVEIIDLSGSRVMEFSDITSPEIRFLADDLKSGIYLYTIQSTDRNSASGKFVVQ